MGVLVITALLAGIFISGGLVLRVVPVRGGTPMAVLWLAPGDTFTIRYNHSVENSPIWETHSVDAKGRIFIEQERYLKFGAGMGKMPGVGRMVQKGPYEIIEDMHMPTGDFILRIGSQGVDHTLVHGNRTINLTAMAPHVAVQFSARPISLLYRVWQQLVIASSSEATAYAK
jgi:hypothetical protein